MPWGPKRRTGSHNITLRGIINWGTWADGINFHGGHHDVLIEDCEMSFTGDDPYGLWPVGSDIINDRFSCQQNIVLRNNVARWPRAGGEGRGSVQAGNFSARDFPDCQCESVPQENVCAYNKTTGKMHSATCCPHPCFATYAGGAGVQFINNTCEGAYLFLLLTGDFTHENITTWCGSVVVANNTVKRMQGQGRGCMTPDGMTGATWCEKAGPPWTRGPYPPAPTIGGQCDPNEKKLPPPCPNEERMNRCKRTPGVGGICANASGPVLCVSATELAEMTASSRLQCAGYTVVCAIV